VIAAIHGRLWDWDWWDALYAIYGLASEAASFGTAFAQRGSDRRVRNGVDAGPFSWDTPLLDCWLARDSRRVRGA